MKILHLGLLFFAALATLILVMYIREFLADFLTFFFNSYLAMAGTSGGDWVWLTAQAIATIVTVWLLFMLWKDFGKTRFDVLMNSSED